MNNTNNPDASLLKRLYALIYDGLLLLAVDIILVFLPASILITFYAINTQTNAYIAAVMLALLFAHFVFYGWFWTHGGQTLGMRAWKLKLTTEDDKSIGWTLALKRFLLGIPAWLLLASALLNLFALQGIVKAALILFALLWWIQDNRAGLWRERLTRSRVVELE